MKDDKTQIKSSITIKLQQDILPDENGKCPKGYKPRVYIDPVTGKRRVECVPENDEDE